MLSRIYFTREASAPFTRASWSKIQIPGAKNACSHGTAILFPNLGLLQSFFILFRKKYLTVVFFRHYYFSFHLPQSSTLSGNQTVAWNFAKKNVYLFPICIPQQNEMLFRGNGRPMEEIFYKRWPGVLFLNICRRPPINDWKHENGPIHAIHIDSAVARCYRRHGSPSQRDATRIQLHDKASDDNMQSAHLPTPSKSWNLRNVCKL